MAPGLDHALSKGHHSSHFLRRQKDLVMYAPQNGTAFLLGGNKGSSHCGKCIPVHAINDRRSLKEAVPRGTCRPATTLIPSHLSPPSLQSKGCKNQAMNRLFVYGYGFFPPTLSHYFCFFHLHSGFVPSTGSCSARLHSLQFSSLACELNCPSHTHSIESNRQKYDFSRFLANPEPSTIQNMFPSESRLTNSSSMSPMLWNSSNKENNSLGSNMSTPLRSNSMDDDNDSHPILMHPQFCLPPRDKDISL